MEKKDKKKIKFCKILNLLIIKIFFTFFFSFLFLEFNIKLLILGKNSFRKPLYLYNIQSNHISLIKFTRYIFYKTLFHIIIYL